MRKGNPYHCGFHWPVAGLSPHAIQVATHLLFSQLKPREDVGHACKLFIRYLPPVPLLPIYGPKAATCWPLLMEPGKMWRGLSKHLTHQYKP